MPSETGAAAAAGAAAVAATTHRLDRPPGTGAKASARALHETLRQRKRRERQRLPDGRSSRASQPGRLRRRLALAGMATFVLIYLIPVFGVVLTSLKSNAEIAARGIWAPTGDLSIDNYFDVWRNANTTRYLINSLQSTIPAVAISVAGGTMIGYALAKLRPRGSGVILLVVVSGLFVPPQVLLVPLFTMFNSHNLDLLNTLWPMILVHSAVGLSITSLVTRNFFEQIRDSLRAAALIDGANEPQVFLRVMLPLARPVLAALATLQFTFIWNDFLYPLVFTTDDDVRTIMLGLLAVKGQFTVAYGNQAALAVMASIPTVLVFFVFQKHFVHGLLAGAVKG